MDSHSCPQFPFWYVLNYIGSSFREQPRKAVDRFNAASGTELELFAPTYVVKENRQGELKFRTVSLTFHYVFVKGPFEEVKKLCAQQNGFSFLIDRGSSERYATIDDRRMANFRNIARAYKNCLPYFPLDDIDLEDGDKVEVVNGDFPGLVGYYMPNARSKSGNIVLNVYNNVGTIAFDVKAKDVRVLEFSPNATRANDQIDAFVPNLLKALEFYGSEEAIPTDLVAKLSMFCGRMEVVKMNNRKLEAKLRVLLYAANRLIGNTSEAERSIARYRELSSSVTNPWTQALIAYILSVIESSPSHLAEARALVAANTPVRPSKAQSQLMEVLVESR